MYCQVGLYKQNTTDDFLYTYFGTNYVDNTHFIHVQPPVISESYKLKALFLLCSEISLNRILTNSLNATTWSLKAKEPYFYSSQA